MGAFIFQILEHMYSWLFNDNFKILDHQTVFVTLAYYHNWIIYICKWWQAIIQPTARSLRKIKHIHHWDTVLVVILSVEIIVNRHSKLSDPQLELDLRFLCKLKATAPFAHCTKYGATGWDHRPILTDPTARWDGGRSKYENEIPEAKGSARSTFEREDPGVGVHERRVGGNGPAEGLAGHGHVDDNDAVLRRGLPDADVPVRLHGDMGEGDELWRDPQARQLQQATKPPPWRPYQSASRKA